MVSNNKNIAFLVDTLSIEKGTGIARYSNNLIKGLRNSGFTVECFFPGSPDDPMAGVVGHTLKLPLKIYKNRNNFDIFHANSPVTGLGLLLTNKPKVITYHDLASILYSPEANLHVKALAPYFYKIGKNCDRVISNSSQTKREMVNYLKFPEDKIVVINLGVDDRFNPIKKDARDCFKIGYIGKLSSRKRIDFLIKAFYLFRKSYSQIDAKLVICGSKTPYYDQLEKMVQDLGLTQYVELKGFVPDDRLNEIYNTFDVLVIPSEWEGFGIPILEAQRCGVPVLIRENVQIPEEVACCCIKCHSEEHMADQIFNILTDEKFYREVSDKGMKHSNTFTWEKMVGETIKVYRELQ